MNSKLYFGGDIITIENDIYTEAVLTENGIIKKVGKLEELRNIAPIDTEEINLTNKTMLPGFLDSHSHLSAVAMTFSIANLHGCKDFQEITDKILEFAKENTDLEEDDWIIGFGYDNNNLEEKRHLDKSVLDNLPVKNPILITHTSGHMGTVNQKGLEILGITEDTKSPEGGKIGRVGNTNEPNGFLEESAFISITGKVPMPDASHIAQLIKKAQKLYASFGITTAQEGLLNLKELGLLQLKPLFLDVIGYVDIKKSQDLLNKNKNLKTYSNGLRLGGYKAFLDGSPQGRTAWLTEPYEGEKEYKGYAIYEDEEVTNFFKIALEEDEQILMHCNGDAAAEQFIRCYKAALKMTKSTGKIRPVIVHSQLLRPDLLPQVKELKIIPTYFVAHTYYWGDIHLKNFGKRGKKISPLKSTADLDILFTLHQDSPVIPPNMIETIWCACNRITKDGQDIGIEERISPLEALKAITINAAYQYFEEDIKGSIKEGKQANFVILSENPLKVNVKDIKNIKVLKTILRDNVIYEDGEDI